MIQFRRVQTENEKLAMYRLRYDVYCHEQKFVNADDCPNGLEIDEYDEHSAHFIAIGEEGIIATVRLIESSPIGLPIEKFFELEHPSTGPNDSNVYSEVSRLIVHPLFRESSLYFIGGLFLALYDYSRKVGITHWYAVLEEFMFETFTSYGFLLQRIGPPDYCLGRTHSPFVLPLEDGINHIARQKPDLVEFLKSNFETSIFN